MTQYLSLDEVYEIHEYMLGESGGRPGVRDFALLHSAVERPRATFDGQDLYANVFIKAAALLHSICMNHSFFDGNKRTAFLSMKRFLYINGYELVSYKEEVVEFMVAVDNEQLELPVITAWIKKHSRLF